MNAPFVRLARATGLIATVLATGSVGGCGDRPRPAAASSALPAAPTDLRGQLAALAATARDQRFTAAYTLAKAGARTRAVMVTVAGDSSWRVDLQGGALSGTMDIALVGVNGSQYQCPLGATASGATLASTPTACIRAASSDKPLPAAIDPGIQYPFTRWLEVLTDTAVAVTITPAQPLGRARGTCFGVEPTTVTLAPPIDSAVLCYTDDGTLTAARGDFGTLTMSGQPSPAPASISLPAPVVSRAPLTINGAPVQPSGSATRAGSPAPSA